MSLSSTTDDKENEPASVHVLLGNDLTFCDRVAKSPDPRGMVEDAI
ncbi:MAG: hypothetical protein AAFY30_09555 [Cyanobacteria bacterium J06642_12]